MDQMENVKAALKRVKEPIIRERLLMVQASFKHPLRDVAKEHGCTHGRVDFWKKRYGAFGLRGLSTKPRMGRPKKISEEQERKFRRVVRKHNIKQGWRTQHVRKLIAKEAGVKYSFRHTIRLIQSWGMSKVKPRPRYAFSKKEDRESFQKKTGRTWHANP